MYIISETTGKIYLNGIEIPLDDSKVEFQTYLIDKEVIGFKYSNEIEVEINAKNKEFYDNWIKNKVTYLLIKAEGYAIGKEGAVDYIKTQIQLYDQKYKDSISLTPIPEVDNDLEFEGMRDFNITLTEFKNLIINRNISSRKAFALFVHYIEQCRSAILTLMSNNEWDKVEQARVIVDGLASPIEAQEVKNLILAI